MSDSNPFFSQARREFHAALLESVLSSDQNGIPTNADKSSRPSVAIARGVMRRLNFSPTGERLAGQRAGTEFEKKCEAYLEQTFPQLAHLRPGMWKVTRSGGLRSSIAKYDQYEHLDVIAKMVKNNSELATVLGTEYLIKPDIVIERYPESDANINAHRALIDATTAARTPLRTANNNNPILHASISCKWTIRSDRSQNARSEALNLVRNRKGRLPHVVLITAEPVPSRIASIALGTGDLDCVYHFALNELHEAVSELDYADAEETLDIMVEGKRLRDISDLPFDLVT